MMTFLKRLFKNTDFLVVSSVFLLGILAFSNNMHPLLQKTILFMVIINLFVLISRIYKPYWVIFFRNFYVLFLCGVYLYGTTQLNTGLDVIILYLFVFFILGVIWVSPIIPVNFFIKNKKISLGNKFLTIVTLMAVISYELINYFTWSLKPL